MSVGASVFIISYITSIFVPKEYFQVEGSSTLIYMVFIIIPLFVTCLCKILSGTHGASPISRERLKRLDCIGSNLSDINKLIVFILLLYMW